MGLDRQLLLTECRTDAHVGDAGMHDTIDRARRRVDAVRRNQLVVGLQVGSGKSDLAATLASGHDNAIDEIRMAKDGAGFVNATFRHEPPDSCAAHHEVLVAYRVDLVSPETVVLAKGA